MRKPACGHWAPPGTPEKSQPAPHGALGEAASIAALVLILDGRALVHSQPLTLTPRWLTSWLGQPKLRDGAPVPTLQMGTTENEGPGGSEPLPWLNVPPRCPSGAALPRAPRSHSLQGRGRPKARSYSRMVTSAPFPISQGSLAGACWRWRARADCQGAVLPQRRCFLSRCQGRGLWTREVPTGKMESWLNGEEAASTGSLPQMVGKVVFGLEVLCAQLVMYKPRQNCICGAQRIGGGGGRSIPFLTTHFSRVSRLLVLQGQI